MTKRLDYSKWDHIEVSDDEDDTHPNIDTPSLFRWRHQARVERMNEFQKEVEQFEKDYNSHVKKLSVVQANFDKAKTARDANPGDSALNDEFSKLKEALDKVQKEDVEWTHKKEDMDKRRRLQPWNVDTICKEKDSKTIINKIADKKPAHSTPSGEEDIDEEVDAITRMNNFVQKYKKQIRTFGMFRRPQDTQNYLLENAYLVCDETASHLVLWCIDLAVEEKYDLMEHVSHQCIVMQFMLELAKSLKIDPRACIRPFFAKFCNPEPEYERAFMSELSAFRLRIRKRAEERISEAMEKYEKEERQKRLGPGGLDPVEVFEQLPKALQECFEHKDLEKLQTVLQAMEPKEAAKYMQMAVDSGMWHPNVNADGEDEGDDAGAGAADDEDDGVYEDATAAAPETEVAPDEAAKQGTSATAATSQSAGLTVENGDAKAS